MLWTIFAILLILWLLGWGFHVAGSLIHLLLVLAVIVLVINLVTACALTHSPQPTSSWTVPWEYQWRCG
jgi:hypothetical protein